MCPISSSTRSDSNSEASGEAGDIAESFTGKDHYQELIRKANTVPIYKIFSHYGIRLNEANKKTICPFKFHKGGRENSASFIWYPHTNTFWCFGCNTGSYCCDFVAYIDGINRINAAYKILKYFNKDIDPDNVLDEERQNFSEKLEIMLDFSKLVRDFINLNNTSKALVFVEEICAVYDILNIKYQMSNEVLKNMTQKLKTKIDSYKPCL
jgi:DNA primase